MHVGVGNTRESKLLEIVLTLRTAGRLTGRLTAGNNRAIKMPMIAITTNNSTSVKPNWGRRVRSVAFIRSIP